MTETPTEPYQNHLLTLFSRLKEGRISAGDLKKKIAAASKRSPGPNASDADVALADLIERGLVTVTGGRADGHHPRPNASYRLTEKGQHYVRPARPDIPDEQLQAQEAFILLQVFRSKEQKLTRSELNGKLRTKAAIGQLELDVRAAPETVDYHLTELVEKRCLGEERRGNSVSYTLNPEHGARALASARQHDGVSFTLTGETLNALIAAGRKTIPDPPRREDLPIPVRPPEMASALRSQPLDEEGITRYIAQLRSDKYAGKDLIPIHEVRRLVAQHHGEEAAGHPFFDPLIKRMRSEGRLRLIAITDSRDATQDELDDSIQGLNETIFYILVR
jgi:DNA-binding PadR family transcriptional regulator